MYDVIVSPFLDKFLIVRPGSSAAVSIPQRAYLEVLDTHPGSSPPKWLSSAVAEGFGVAISDRPFGESVVVRSGSGLGYVRASYELNLGCNYDCEHCYLGEKRFEGLAWEGREKLLGVMRDAGVLWLQLTGGEPLIDPLFPRVYETAWRMGMMISISSNGSRLASPHILDLLSAYRPYRITLSVYGATEESYDGLTRRRGSFRRFIKGLDAGVAAGLPIRLNVIVTTHNQHEVAAMEAMATSRGLKHHTFVNMSPTIYGGAESLPAQSTEYLRKRRPFSGCNAGHTFFHSDPFGRASICKVGRDDAIDLTAEGLDGLTRLGEIADRLMLRTGGCSGCALSGTCYTCRPLAKLYQQSKAPLNLYCQHAEGR